MIQSKWVAAELVRMHEGLEVEIVEIKTTGDLKLEATLSELGGKGAFTLELEQAMLAGKIDLAVHSLKDLPTDLPEGLTLGCTPEREDPSDALVFRDAPSNVGDPLFALKEGATVGTSSLRRRAQLLAKRPDLNVIEFRGNVDTRLRKLEEGQADATLLAVSGLKRLGFWADGQVYDKFAAPLLSAPEWLPAVGQAALGIECRGDDETTLDLLKPLNHDETMRAVTAERGFLYSLGVGCQAPVAALCIAEGSKVEMTGRIFSEDGQQMFEQTAGCGNENGLGKLVADMCRAAGADKVI
jgi:hydroxymethylbilane synthase